MLLNELNNLTRNRTPSISHLSGSSRVVESVVKPVNKGKLIKRVSDAKGKKEKKKIIEEWVLLEIAKINKDSEVEDF